MALSVKLVSFMTLRVVRGCSDVHARLSVRERALFITLNLTAVFVSG